MRRSYRGPVAAAVFLIVSFNHEPWDHFRSHRVGEADQRQPGIFHGGAGCFRLLL